MNKNILIVYYTHSSNTKKVAQFIHHMVGGTLVELEPEKPYPASYDACVDQAKEEIRASYRPALKTTIPDMKSYDVVLVGTPNWWSTMAPPVASFMSACDLTGKTVAPFLTHGGGGAGHIERDISALCGGATLTPALIISGDGGARREQQAKAWLAAIGLGGE